MLSEAITLGVITDQETETCDAVHTTIDLYLAEQNLSFTGRMEDMIAHILADLVQTEAVTQEQADTFLDVHDCLG